jgi:hypothetical protein
MRGDGICNAKAAKLTIADEVLAEDGNYAAAVNRRDGRSDGVDIRMHLVMELDGTQRATTVTVRDLHTRVTGAQRRSAANHRRRHHRMRINHPPLMTLDLARLSLAIRSKFPVATHTVAVHHLVAEAALYILANTVARDGDECATADGTRGRID